MLWIKFSRIFSYIREKRNGSIVAESLLSIEVTSASLIFSANIPVANDILKMIERCLIISSLSSLGILIEMLFGPADLLG